MISVAFDARKFADYGIGTYVRRLLEGFASRPSEIRCSVFLGKNDKGLAPVQPAWETENVPYQPYGLGEFVLFGEKIRRTGCQLFHTPHYTTPLAPGIPTVVTVHDLIHLRFPGYFNAFQRTYARLMIGHAVRTSRAIITDSEATRKDLVEMVGAPEARISVIPLGVDSVFKPSEAAAVKDVRLRYQLPDRYVVFLGNPKPHKGIDVLIHAMSLIANKDKDLHLAIVGGSEHDQKTISAMAASVQLEERVRHLRHVPEGDLPAVISGARMLVMPSRWEGFGLPVLEAMACGTPVVSTRAGSLPEVAGSAAVMVEPENAGELAEAILNVERDPNLRARLQADGVVRSKQFRWERTVVETMKVYRSVL